MSYRGQIAEIPLGAEGMTGNKNLSQVRPTQLLRAQNITYENGTLQKEGGDILYTPTAIDGGVPILGGWDWWPSIGTQRSIILNSHGNVFKDAGSGNYGTTLLSGQSVTDVVPIFVDGGREGAALPRKLFLFTGLNQVSVLSGDNNTMASITLPPTDWTGIFPKTGLVHEGRLWGFMGHIAYYSSTTDHEDFSSFGSGLITVYPGEGEEIVAAFVYRGFIVCCKKPFGWYLLDTSDPNTTNWSVSRITGQIGVAGPRATCLVDGDALVMDISGELFNLTSVTTENDIRPKSMTEQSFFSPWIRDNTNAAQYNKAQAIYYAAKRQGWLAVAGAGQTTNTIRIKTDVLSGTLKYAYSDFVTCEALWLRKDVNNIPRPMAGDSLGFVRLLDQDARTHDNGGIASQFQTPHANFLTQNPDSPALRRMNGQFLELVYEPKGLWDLSVDIIWDGRQVQTLQYSMGGSQAVLGITTTLDIDFVLGGSEIKTLRKRIVGSGRRFSMIGRNSVAGQDFSIAKAYLHFGVGDER